MVRVLYCCQALLRKSFLHNHNTRHCYLLLSRTHVSFHERKARRSAHLLERTNYLKNSITESLHLFANLNKHNVCVTSENKSCKTVHLCSIYFGYGTHVKSGDDCFRLGARSCWALFTKPPIVIAKVYRHTTPRAFQIGAPIPHHLGSLTLLQAQSSDT